MILNLLEIGREKKLDFKKPKFINKNEQYFLN